ncbi:alpha/beta fold hydrolase [Nocardioides bizhenqiangii]|uniref:Alpha/beta hydrolase n=1 Tax=Nocardioides bizhenqiangii TaxID=3095076 RepID=A0ABZ0ZMD6_9ACTN|nr:alpha/beta hydrolase [Nocardioides sp. HM61]WQQ25368.1 alpha/beta hydrolase [Nocardioides sp. HM61]
MAIGRRLATTALAAFALTAIGLTQASAFPQPDSSPTATSAVFDSGDAVRPTIVLEHGAWADASSWNRVIGGLMRDDYEVIAAPNPLRGLAPDAAALRGLLATIAGPIVLVGHSYGGAVITEAATGNPQVKALVYIAAYAPDENESIGELSARPVEHSAPALPIVPVPTTALDGSTVLDLYLDRAGFRAAFAADVPARVAARLAATQRPIEASALGGRVTRPAWDAIPSWYLVATKDRAISPDLERFMADRAGSHVIEVDSSHAAPVSHPVAVTRLIERAARVTR